jgi:hypothetical protein
MGSAFNDAAPPSSTMMRSASTTVPRRWAMTNVVRPRSKVSIAICTTSSDGVERQSRLVEHEDWRILQQRAGDRDALPFAD